MDIIANAIKKGRYVLSEYESKQVLRNSFIPVTKDIPVRNKKELEKAAKAIGFPLVMKGCSYKLIHKTEHGVVYKDIRDMNEAYYIFDELYKKINKFEDWTILVQNFIKGDREFMVGMIKDPLFGSCVMFGLGGMFAEAIGDVSFRMAPLDKVDAMEMLYEIKNKKILEPIRGLPGVDVNILAEIIVTIGNIGLENKQIREIDLNPIIISHSKPIVVDALVVLEKTRS